MTNNDSLENNVSSAYSRFKEVSKLPDVKIHVTANPVNVYVGAWMAAPTSIITPDKVIPYDDGVEVIYNEGKMYDAAMPRSGHEGKHGFIFCQLPFGSNNEEQVADIQQPTPTSVLVEYLIPKAN